MQTGSTRYQQHMQKEQPVYEYCVYIHSTPASSRTTAQCSKDTMSLRDAAVQWIVTHHLILHERVAGLELRDDSFQRCPGERISLHTQRIVETHPSSGQLIQQIYTACTPDFVIVQPS
jgi:hypothetical protein